jgi:hypothetical protein
MRPRNPAAIVEGLEKKLDQQYGDPATTEQQSPVESAEDANPGAADTEANTVEPPD